MAAMPSRRPTAAELFGIHLRKLREAKGFGLRQAVSIAGKKGLTLVTVNTLGGIERGETKKFNPEVIRQVASVYKVDVSALLNAYIAIQSTGRDLPRHAQTLDSNATQFDQTGETLDAGSTDATRALSHRDADIIFDTAAALMELADRATNLAKRLAGVAADLGYDLTRRQNAMAGPDTSTHPAHDRSHDRPSHRARQTRSKSA